MDDDENPEWTDEDFVRARPGAPWMWPEHRARDLREKAKRLREEAAALEAEADRIAETG
ncbi:MAG: hypothetical protein AAGF71_11470 [Pseudomonadota bacterium]